MKILVAFPDVAYYNWQVLVQINNLVKFGYSDQIIYVVGKNEGKNLSPQIKGVLDNTPVEYHVYDDTRENAQYPSSLRPHIVQKFFEEFPEMSGETFFYVDPDILFAKAINFGVIENNDTWYLSDTRSYIDSQYIKSKDEELFDTMCQIVKIDKNIVESNDVNAGGAQYLMKNLTAEYWKKVYRDSEDLYGFMKRTEGYYNPQHPIQSWTADMWAVLWNAWYFGHETKIASRLSFSWATDSIVSWDQHNLFHNAGVFRQTNMFDKITYQTSPFNADFSHVSPNFCCYKYVEEIDETKNNYPDLITLF
jgi:hypothetical protein